MPRVERGYFAHGLLKKIKPDNHAVFGAFIFGLFIAGNEIMLVFMKFTLPPYGIPTRCYTCLYACVGCHARRSDEATARRMAELVKDLVRGQLEWTPGWRKMEIAESED